MCTDVYNSTAEELSHVMKTFHKDISALAKDKLALQAKVDEMEQLYQEKMKYLINFRRKLQRVQLQ